MWGMRTIKGLAFEKQAQVMLEDDTYAGLMMDTLHVKVWADTGDYYAEMSQPLYDLVNEEVESYAMNDNLIDEEDANKFRLLLLELDRIKLNIEQHLPKVL